MAYSRTVAGHTYVYEVYYGEEMGVARIIVHSDAAAGEGLFLVKSSGSVECAEDLPGFSTNKLLRNGRWPEPPFEAIEDARRIAEAKSRS